MAETSGLLNRRALKGAPRVRIPASPPAATFQRTITTYCERWKVADCCAFTWILRSLAFAEDRGKPRKIYAQSYGWLDR